MESAEKEKVKFTKKIVPSDAQGLVEQWLAQVRIHIRITLNSSLVHWDLRKPSDLPGQKFIFELVFGKFKTSISRSEIN